MARRICWRWLSVGSMLGAGVLLGVACGSSGGTGGTNLFGDGGPDATSGSHRDGGSGTGTGGGKKGDGGKLGKGGDSGQGGNRDDGPVENTDAGCAANTQKASRRPAYLVFLMDHSDSMGASHKWTACSAALESFFSDPNTSNLSASLTFMPYLPDGGHASCEAGSYVEPDVPMTALPSSTFTTVIAAEPLQLGTPTRPSLEGVMQYAETQQAAHPGNKVLIVLATDGYPAGCGGTYNNTSTVADAASVSEGKYGIPVYVIGVGPATAANDAGIKDLNRVAEAGGTGSAFFIPTENGSPDASITTNAFLAAIQQIQSSLGCDYAIPPAPDGGQIDFDQVNVILTVHDAGTTLDYSGGCDAGTGWRYEGDAADPNGIALCPSTCTIAKGAGSSGEMSIVFGCKTQGGTPPSK